MIKAIFLLIFGLSVYIGSWLISDNHISGWLACLVYMTGARTLDYLTKK